MACWVREKTPEINAWEAITAANTNAAFGGCAAGSPGADTINLPAGTYTLALANSGPRLRPLAA